MTKRTTKRAKSRGEESGISGVDGAEEAEIELHEADGQVQDTSGRMDDGEINAIKGDTAELVEVVAEGPEANSSGREA